MRSQLSRLEKLDMGRVRRRTSRKARSMTLVVRTLIQWSCGTAKKFSRVSRSRSTQATALGRRCCQCCFQSRKARWAAVEQRLHPQEAIQPESPKDHRHHREANGRRCEWCTALHGGNYPTG